MNKSYLAVVLCLFLATVAAAQPNDVTKPAIKPAVDKTAKDPEAERLAKQRRDNAQALLISLAADAGRFGDQTLRARTQARIADVLWSADPDRARALFRKAWESAEIVDQEERRQRRRHGTTRHSQRGLANGRPSRSRAGRRAPGEAQGREGTASNRCRQQTAVRSLRSPGSRAPKAGSRAPIARCRRRASASVCGPCAWQYHERGNRFPFISPREGSGCGRSEIRGLVVDGCEQSSVRR